MSRDGRVMEYDVVTAQSPHLLEPEVRRLLSEGWEVQGGIAIDTREYVDHRYLQAMIRRADA